MLFGVALRLCGDASEAEEIAQEAFLRVWTKAPNWRSAEGDFHFVDRRKNVIRRSGENISALEVESVLNQHPAVAASGVAAIVIPGFSLRAFWKPVSRSVSAGWPAMPRMFTRPSADKV